MDPAQIEEIGQFIGQEISKLKPTEQAPVQAPAVTFNIDTDKIAAAIAQAQLGFLSVGTLLNQIVEGVGAVDLPGIQEAIRETAINETLGNLIETMQTTAKSISDANMKNIETLAGAVIKLGQSHADQTKKLVEAVARQGREIETLKNMQTEMIEAMYAPRDFVFDSDGNPTGLRIDRNLNS
jgi:hypothetical protein